MGDLFHFPTLNPHGGSDGVVIPSQHHIIHLAPQYGINRETHKVVGKDINVQVEAAFANVEEALRIGGVHEGLLAIVRIKVFVIDIKFSETIREFYRKKFPNHRPIWSIVHVQHIDVEEALFFLEIDAVVKEIHRRL